ncbi:transcriptional regulatory protein [Geomonas sp. Red276]
MDSLKVLVVDDDFMIARMHAKFIEQQEGYRPVGIAKNFQETIELARELRPELILLDVYLPDRSGIEALREIRGENLPCDVILITAAKEIETIEEAFRLGIFDYLIKPFDLDLLKGALAKYRQFKSHLLLGGNADQKFVEGLKQFRGPKTAPQQLPKGIDQRTLELVKGVLIADASFRTADQIAQTAGLSRSTARAYLDHLVEQGMVEESLQYGAVGRPQRQFRLKNG